MLKDLSRVGFAAHAHSGKGPAPALEGRDVLGCAQTGTGKTAAFVIPMVERLAGSPKGPPRGLILAPTRELAFQIQETIDDLGRSLRVYATTVVGGADVQAQLRGLKQHPEIIVATPGRLLDLMWDGHIDLREVEVVVLDEADRMLDLGFADQLNQIIDALPPGRQSFLYSATLPTDLEELVRMSLQDPLPPVVAKPATRRTVSRTCCTTPRPGPRHRCCCPCLKTVTSRCWCSPAPRAAPTSSPRPCGAAATGPLRSTATCRWNGAGRRWRGSGAAVTGSWWPRTSPPGPGHRQHRPRHQLRPALHAGRLRAPHRRTARMTAVGRATSFATAATPSRCVPSRTSWDDPSPGRDEPTRREAA